MDNTSSKREEKGQGQGVIIPQSVIRRKRLQKEARAGARRYFRTCQRLALERHLVMRLLNRTTGDGPQLPAG